MIDVLRRALTDFAVRKQSGIISYDEVVGISWLGMKLGENCLAFAEWNDWNNEKKME